MKLKRTVTLAILAAVLSANLVSCVAEREPQGTGEYYTGEDDTLPIDPDNSAKDDAYETVSKTVYLSRKSTLEAVDSSVESVKDLAVATELTVVAQSKQWYKVSYQGNQYYVSRGRTTDDDLGEKTFSSCSKTMYINSDGVNVRPYPSLGSFSDPIATKVKGDEVKVVAQSTSTGWSKVEFTQSGKTVTGFIKTSLLTSNSSGEKDFAKEFKEITSKTVYVNVESTANLRAEPYLPDEDQGYEGGTLVVGNGVPRGTALTAIAEGTVNGVAWYQVYYKKDDNSKSIKCYITKSSVSEVKPKDSYTTDELITDYKYTRLDGEVTAYPYDTSINVRETPSTASRVLVSVRQDALTVYAYGQSLSGGATWCIVKTKDGTVGFAWYDGLTLDSSGKTMVSIPLSLDHLLSVYKFEKLPESEVKTPKGDVNLWGTPDSEKVLKTVGKDTQITVVATGKMGPDDAYIVQIDNVYYFALKSAFN